MKQIKYPILEGEIAARGIKKTAIAAKIGCTYRTFVNKCSGKSRFTWDEVQQINATFFPDMTNEHLMRTNAQ